MCAKAWFRATIIGICCFAFNLSLQAQRSFGQKPGTGVGFQENIGQFIDQTGQPQKSLRYLLRTGNGMNVQLRDHGFSYDTYEVPAAENHRVPSNRIGQSLGQGRETPLIRKFHRVDIDLIGSNPAPQTLAEQLLVCRYNYRIAGSMRTARAFGRLIYADIYPQIDLVFEGGGAALEKTLEYFFVVRPGGNPRDIQLHFSGANRTKLVNNRIFLEVDRGSWSERIPESYLNSTERNSTLRRGDSRQINVVYCQLSTDTYGFKIPLYDHSKTLIIDPTPDLSWGTYLGDDLNDWSQAMAKDAAGNLFIGGASCNSIIATSGAFKSTVSGWSDALVGKFTADGQPLWIAFYGGIETEDIFALAVDQNNDIVAAGITFSSDNIGTPGTEKPEKTTPNYMLDAFVLKLGNDGGLKWATYYGGDSSTYGLGIAVDKQNDIYLVGMTNCKTGISTPSCFQPAYGGGQDGDMLDAYLAKFTPEGKRIWGTYVGGNKPERFTSVLVDRDQNIYAAGSTGTMTGMASSASFQPVFGGYVSDGLLTKFNPAGNLLWSTYYGGESDDLITSLCLDPQNNLIMGGTTRSQSYMASTGAEQTMYQGGGVYPYGFLCKISPAGQRLWGRYYGGTGECVVDGVACDATGNIAVTGVTAALDQSTPGAYQTDRAGVSGNAFVSFFDGQGYRTWCTYYGREGNYAWGEGQAILISEGSVFVTGETTCSENIASCDAYQDHFVNNQDIFLARFTTGSIKDLPSVKITQDKPNPVCSNIPVAFHAEVKNMGPDMVYQWYLNGQLVGGNQPDYTTSGLRTNDSVRCLLAKSGNCLAGSFSSNSIYITLDPGFPVTAGISGPPDSVCQGTDARFVATPGNAGSEPEYRWYVNGVGTGVDSVIFHTTGLNNGDEVSCQIVDHKACTVDSIGISNIYEAKVRNIQTPSVTITAEGLPACEGQVVRFVAALTNSVPATTLTWSINTQSMNEHQVELSTTALVNNDAVDCYLTVSNSICAVETIHSNSVVAVVKMNPRISLPEQIIVALGKKTSLPLTSQDSDLSYQWAPAAGLTDAAAASPGASPAVSTQYYVTATNAEGCATKKGIDVVVITKIMVPNAFSPNGDGKNDLFRIYYNNEISDISLSIFDRWGALIYKTQNPAQGWDGNFGGKVQPAGVYVWQLKYRNADQQRESQSGTLLLLR